MYEFNYHKAATLSNVNDNSLICSDVLDFWRDFDLLKMKANGFDQKVTQILNIVVKTLFDYAVLVNSQVLQRNLFLS